jgi:hypothetical protein
VFTTLATAFFQSEVVDNCLCGFFDPSFSFSPPGVAAGTLEESLGGSSRIVTVLLALDP